METLLGQHYQTILESLPNGIYVVDTSRRIVFWNDGADAVDSSMAHAGRALSNARSGGKSIAIL
jgi:PAS fold